MNFDSSSDTASVRSPAEVPVWERLCPDHVAEGEKEGFADE